VKNNFKTKKPPLSGNEIYILATCANKYVSNMNDIGLMLPL
jgi:hypothetical protein